MLEPTGSTNEQGPSEIVSQSYRDALDSITRSAPAFTMAMPAICRFRFRFRIHLSPHTTIGTSAPLYHVLLLLRRVLPVSCLQRAHAKITFKSKPVTPNASFFCHTRLPLAALSDTLIANASLHRISASITNREWLASMVVRFLRFEHIYWRAMIRETYSNIGACSRCW